MTYFVATGDSALNYDMKTISLIATDHGSLCAERVVSLGSLHLSFHYWSINKLTSLLHAACICLPACLVYFNTIKTQIHITVRRWNQVCVSVTEWQINACYRIFVFYKMAAAHLQRTITPFTDTQHGYKGDLGLSYNKYSHTINRFSTRLQNIQLYLNENPIY